MSVLQNIAQLINENRLEEALLLLNNSIKQKLFFISINGSKVYAGTDNAL